MLFLTQHPVGTFGCVLSLHFEWMNNALVSLHGNARHGEDSGYNRCGLDEWNCFTNQHTCKMGGNNALH